jgi:hypothetical protein
MKLTLTRALGWAAGLSMIAPPYLLAQDVAPPDSVAPAITSAATAPRNFSQQELDQLLAPIALYPDTLLAQILMASTYPLEVVQAARWTRTHSHLKGDQLQAALQEQTWDPSVKGLVTVPQVLEMMDERLDWTQSLGDAFLAQRQEVMDTVQNLRARAQVAGNLTSTPQQTVITEGNVVRIEPASPQVVYVPVYNPAVIYGPWWWPAPPYYWYPPGYIVSNTPFVAFSFGLFVGAAIWGQCDWGHGTVAVNVHHYNTFNRTQITHPQWGHDVQHRRGVPYRDDAIRREFGRALPGAQARQEFRGHEAPPGPGGVARPRTEDVRRELARPGAGIPARPQPGASTAVPRSAFPRHDPPAFESFGRGDAVKGYSERGAASRGTFPGGGAQVPRGAFPQGGGAQVPRGAFPQGGGAQVPRGAFPQGGGAQVPRGAFPQGGGAQVPRGTFPQGGGAQVPRGAFPPGGGGAQPPRGGAPQGGGGQGARSHGSSAQGRPAPRP